MTASLIFHIGVAIALLSIVSAPISTPRFRQHPIIHFALAPPRGPGGGGGMRELPPASRGRLPKVSPRVFTPPMILAKAQDPVLLMPPALVAAPDLTVVNLPQWGDPLSNSLFRSGGPGDGGGMGSGHDGGLGPGHGPGTGPGDRPGSSGSMTMSFSGISAPELLYKVEPEFSEEARRAKHYGTVLLLVEVDTSGRAVNIRVTKALGLGLDEKAVEAVSRWRFRPARKNGKAVVVEASVEVNFHLL
jgi:protein TonB